LPDGINNMTAEQPACPAPIADVLAYNLRVRLAELGWNQKDLSDASGITRKQVSLIARGAGNPQLRTAPPDQPARRAPYVATVFGPLELLIVRRYQ
jgi:DNA-binding XRE family transcriptional regulator